MYKLIGCGEYNGFYVDELGDLYKYDLNLNKKIKVQGLGTVFAIGTGLQNAIVCHKTATADGQVSIVHPDGSIFHTKITDGISLSGFHTLDPAYDTYAVICKSGLKCFDEQGNFTLMQNPQGLTFTKIIAAWRLTCLDSLGGVTEYPWFQPGTKNVQTVSQLASLVPNKVSLPAKATDICSSKSQFSIAVVGGKPYGWCGAFGSPFFSSDFGKVINTPIDLSTAWGLTVGIDKISANDNTIHFIDTTKDLWGLGFNSIGEVGNGQRAPGVISTGGWNLAYDGPADQILWQHTPVNVSRGRKYQQLATGNYMVYYKYAQLTDGSWTSCGGREKGGTLGNGIRKSDDTNIDLLDVPVFTIVSIPDTLKIVDEAWIKTPGNYPVAEPSVIQPPTGVVDPPAKKAVLQITTYSDGTAEVKTL